MRDNRSTRRSLAVTLLTILAVAAGLRLFSLPDLPLGLHYDEAANGILSAEIARGTQRPIFIPSYTGKEVLFFYWAASWMRVLGPNVLALRLTAALAGLCTVGAAAWSTYELLHGRRHARWIAVLSAAFLATSLWHLILSRLGFRAITQPLLQALTVGALWRGLRLERRRWLIVAGLLCGGTAYTYLAARAFPIPLAAGLAGLLIVERARFRARLGQVALFVAAAALALAPLAIYFARHPASLTTRMGQVAAGSWAEVWDGLRAGLGMFFVRGDPYVRFNLPGRPIFGPALAVLFLLGIVALFLARRERPAEDRSGVAIAARVFLFVTLPVMLLPSALATGEITPSNLRAVGLLPFVYVLPALGLARLVPRRAPRHTFLAITLLFTVLLGIDTARSYFGEWAASPALYEAADGDLVDMAHALDESSLVGITPYVASVHYRHPTLAFLSRIYPEIQWLTGGETLVLPARRQGLLLLSRSAGGGVTWMEPLLAETGTRGLPTRPGPDGEPAFRAYIIPEQVTLTPTHPLTARFGSGVTLLGYDLLQPAQSGGTVEVLLYWRVEDATQPPDLLPAVRLTDAWSGMWGEARPFHYPAEQWEPGELVVDHLSVPVAPGAPPGQYTLQLSFFAASTGSSLPVLDEEGGYAGTSVGLPVPVERAAIPPDPAALGIRQRLDEKTDSGLTLLGGNLDTPSVRPGEPMYLTLFWQAERAPEPGLAVRLSLGEQVLYQGEPVHDTYPTGEWTAGELVADRYDPRLDREAAPGTFPLTLEVLREDGTVVLETTLGEVEVQVSERLFEVPDFAYPAGVPLGSRVELLGYDLQPALPTPGRPVTLTLYWQALAGMETSYTVFTHLLGPGGPSVAQHDGVPAGGTYPTTMWVPGEVVIDRHVLNLPAGLGAGEYTLEVGMYVVETGERLAVPGVPDDALRFPVTIP